MATPPLSSPTVLIVRIFWMMLGPLLLAACAFSIVSAGTGWLTLLDAGYFAVLAATILSRHVEFRSGHAVTGSVEPMSRDHLYRYSMLMASIGAMIWVGANLVGNHWLSR